MAVPVRTGEVVGVGGALLHWGWSRWRSEGLGRIRIGCTLRHVPVELIRRLFHGRRGIWRCVNRRGRTDEVDGGGDGWAYRIAVACSFPFVSSVARLALFWMYLMDPWISTINDDATDDVRPGWVALEG